ncbi:hypothetical protein [Hymenobacter mucosus]|uniref:Lipoprotein n=1 Tax=Hymenobacter mucosus TaxID=1411120 RepID=A0A238V6Z1_9BACT|nr:hypothetical protein [Hymenobacter mucosus]SNR29998.1 hypothetical protein SAMN06269173_101219 [Hymenobacter mucosus]
MHNPYFFELKRTLRTLLALSVTAATLAGCENTTDAGPELGREYYPLAVGAYRIYDVADTSYSNFTATIQRYQYKEKDSTLVTDAAGLPAYQVVRYRRAARNEPWRFDSVLLVTPTAQALQVQRSNLRTVELVFPVREGRTWNQNAFNSRDSITAETRFYNRVNQPFTYSNGSRQFSYNETVTTSNLFGRGEVNLFYATVRRAVYAKGVGLVYRVRRDFAFCDNSPGCIPNASRPNSGRSRWEVLVESGK